MARSRWVEISCDYCSQGDYYKPGNVTAQARKNGWIVSKHGDFCGRSCMTIFVGNKNDPTRKLLQGKT